MDLCGAVSLTLVVAVALAAAVYAIVAAANRVAGGDSRDGSSRRPARQRCLACGAFFGGLHEECPGCGLEPSSGTAKELRDLEASAREMQTLADRGLIGPETAESVYHAIEARQQQLLGRRRAKTREAAAQRATPVPVPPVPEDARPVMTATLVEETAPPPAFTPGLVPIVVREASAGAVEGGSKRAAAAPAAPPREAVPAPPRRSWGETFAAFMEERNILWGELVGGVLIVGCSIALVVSLWSKLAEIAYFPFFILSALTVGLFAAGMYTLHHWKLEATSRGLLLIATLLTPLDFLIFAALMQDREAGFFDWGLAAAAIAGFAALVHRAGRFLFHVGVGSVPSPPGTPGGEGTEAFVNGTASAGWMSALLTVAVLGVSVTQIFVPGWLDTAGPETASFVAVSLVPIAFQAAASAVFLAPFLRREVAVHDGKAILLFLSLTFFAAATSLGFIVAWSDDRLVALGRLAVALDVAALPLLLGGRLMQRTDDTSVEATGMSAEFCWFLGALLSGFGIALLFVSLGLAWPRLVPMTVLSVLNAIVLLATGAQVRSRWLHAPGLFFLTIGFLLAARGLQGEWPGVVDGAGLWSMLTSPASGSLLTFLGLALAAAAEVWARRRRSDLAPTYLGASGMIALVAMGLVCQPEGTSLRAAAVFALCGSGALAANVRWRWPALTAAASLVLLGAVVFLLQATAPYVAVGSRWLVALSLHAGVAIVASIVLERLWTGGPPASCIEDLERGFVQPLRALGLLTSALAILPALLVLAWATLEGEAAFFLFLGMMWLWVAAREKSLALFSLGQGALLVAAGLAATAWLRDQPWIAWRADRLVDVPGIQTYLLVLGGFGLAWQIIRRLAPGSILKSPTDDTGPLDVDRGALAMAWVGQLVLLVCAVTVEAARELTAVHLALPAATALWPAFAWAAIGLLATHWLLELRSSGPIAATLRFWVLGESVALLMALGAGDDLASASAARWVLTAWLGFGSVMLWLRSRLGQRFFEASSPSVQETAAMWLRRLLLLGALAPVLVLTAWTAFLGFAAVATAGPALGSWFHEVGAFASMLTPLLASVAVLVGHGLRDHRAGYLFSAGLLLAATVMGGYALAQVIAVGGLSVSAGLATLQLGALTVGLYSLAWLACGFGRSGGYLASYLALGGLLAGVVLGPAGIEMIWGRPPWSSWMAGAAGWLGWLSVSTLAMAAFWSVRRFVGRGAIHVIGATGVVFAVLLACSFALGDTGGWRGYHVLTLGWAGLALFLLSASWVGATTGAIGPAFWDEDRRRRAARALAGLFPTTRARRWVDVLGLAVVALALGGAWGDPSRPYWSCAATLTVSLLFAASAIWSRRPGYVYASGLLLQLVAFLVWQAWLVDVWGVAVWFIVAPDLFERFVLLQVIAASSGALVWGLVEMVLRRREPPIDVRGGAVAYSHFAALAALHTLAIVILTALASDVFGLQVHLHGALTWAALVLTATGIAVTTWDPEAQARGLPLPHLFVLGLLAVLLPLHQANLTPRDLGPALALALATYAVVWSVAVRFSGWWKGIARRLAVPARVDGWLQGWLPLALGVIGAAATGLSVWVSLDFDAPASLAGAGTVLLLALAYGLRSSTIDPRKPEMLAVFSMLWLALLEAGWALVPRAIPAPWLHHNVVFLSVSALAALGASWFSVRRLDSPTPWRETAAVFGRCMLWLAAASLVMVLGQEFLLYDPASRTTPLVLTGVLAVAAWLGVAIPICLWLALGRTPWGDVLSERGRTVCVWLAEAALVGLLLHVRLNVPGVFGFMAGIWPFVLVGLGFAGVGLSEWSRRRGLTPLTGPLNLTGLFLPLVPLAAYLVRPLADFAPLERAVPGVQVLLRYIERLPNHAGVHASLWLLLGCLYAWVAILRRASGWSLAAALAANFGLWVILGAQESTAFLLHPQIWLAPVGIILLAAEWLYRDRLTPTQSQAARHVGLLVIYVSSAADMFITGLGHSVVLPIVLALLATLGVLAGILLRVRAFLFQGMAFLLLVVFAQIWHAAVDRGHTWIWWASGIVLGAAILALFGLFEKRKNEVVRVLEEMKRWR